MTAKRIGIVIPCFNEAGNLENLIRECEFVASTSNYEFVLVNNGSSDNSNEILQEIQSLNIKILNLEENAGYGGGILAGLKVLETDYVGWIHADLQTDLRKSLLSLDNQNFEFFKGIRYGRSLSERFLSAGMGVLCSILFRTFLFEINAQPTIMKRALFESWINPPTDFSLDLYALVFAKKKDLKITRIKFEFLKRTSGHSTWNFGLRSRCKMVSKTIKYAFLLASKGVR
jgi:glycosyltransferase involved in cell wall biosynthesis